MMRVLMLGGTGSIGAAIVRELVARGHDVSGLARSDGAAAKLAALGATALPGDIAAPGRWVGALQAFDAVIHAACDILLSSMPSPLNAAQPVPAISVRRSTASRRKHRARLRGGAKPAGASRRSPPPTPSPPNSATGRAVMLSTSN
jgi:uncharacterized protein YbjT (DUF2867 family)